MPFSVLQNPPGGTDSLNVNRTSNLLFHSPVESASFPPESDPSPLMAQRRPEDGGGMLKWRCCAAGIPKYLTSAPEPQSPLAGQA